jgi:hypothetical protein
LEASTGEAETESEIFHKHLNSQAFFTGILSLYASIYKEKRESLQGNNKEPTQETALQPEKKADVERGITTMKTRTAPKRRRTHLRITKNHGR